ncbi:hypothetical protein NP493_975g04019 [Ridgeia piscesae]|uniref:Uncharacterized protein n=1 Tax=Ridgeia piscesae TaxID=27915 RepID=A0AAD9NJG6_RIDPI|nr:hypothetical protein NP493_975g04019 [Ridgeia piscesae]
MASSRALLFVFAVSVAVSAVFAYDCADVTRRQWGAKSPRRGYKWIPAVSYVFIHHSASAPCFSTSACAAKVRSFQNYHMNSKRTSMD